MLQNERQIIKLSGVLDQFYGQKIHQLIRIKYSQRDVEAILNNYISEPDNEKYKAEFLELQAYRAECKKQAKLEVYGEE